MFKTIRRIMNWSSAYKKRLYLGFVCSFFMHWAAAAPTMISAYALGEVIESYWRGAALPEGLIWKSSLLIVASILLRFLLAYGRAALQESIGHEQAAGERIKLGDLLKRVPLGYFEQNTIGDLLSGMTTALSSVELQSMKMIDAVINGYINFLVIALCLCFFSPAASLTAAAAVLLSACVLQKISRRSEENASQAHRASASLAGAAVEYVEGLPLVKSFGQEGAAMERARRACRSLRDINVKIELGFTPYNCLHLLILKTASVALVLLCSVQTLKGQMDLSIFLMFLLFSFTIFSCVENINDAAHVLGVVDSAMDKIEKLKEAEFIDRDGKEIELSSQDIRFSHVFFGYGERTILKDVSFFLPENTTTAIVGPSGSGKTTICSLIARFYDVDGGKITLGGHDVREFTCDSLLSHISMVFQNVYLFHDTIRNNIRFGRPEASEEEIVSAAKAARCHDFITALPDGYDTIVGEGGGTLSGGEKQRISIARAILKDAPVVILDEATASLDPENEHLIQEALSALTRGKTIITIAHRLATIENADQILVVDDGKIVQNGTHEELLSREGLYSRFISIRREAEGWRF